MLVSIETLKDLSFVLQAGRVIHIEEKRQDARHWAITKGYAVGKPKAIKRAGAKRGAH